MGSKMHNEKQKMAHVGISLKDIADFIWRNRLSVSIGSLTGLLLSVAYIALAPKIYEARCELQMAQVINVNGNNGNSSISIEEPAALVQRLRAPTAFPAELRKICGLHEDGDFKDYLDGKLRIDAVRNVSNAVDMKVFSYSPSQVRQCAESIVAMIVVQQRGMVEEHLAGRPEQLLVYQKTLSEEQAQLEKIQSTELSNFGYLAKLGTLSWLHTRIDALEEALLSRKHPAKLIFPIFVSNKPVSPNVELALVLGVVLGFFLGVLLAFARYFAQRDEST